jgi:linoleoyl-CoA desaturase
MPTVASPRVALPTPTADNPTAPTESVGRPKFPRDEVGFLTELRRRVDAYFATTKLRDRDNWQMYLKSAVIFAWLAVTYVLLLFVVDTLWLAIPLAVVFAVGIGAVGFSIQHDGGHQAYSRRTWVNKLAAFSLDLIGASSYLWHWKHVVYHHTYPNVDGQDTDIDPGAVARLCPHQKRRWFHRWQHLYLWPAYALTASRWHLMGDFKEFFGAKIGPHPIPKPKAKDWVVFFLGKAFSVGIMLVVPMFFYPWYVVVGFYFLITGVAGAWMTTVFQLAHCVGEADFPRPDGETNRMEASWAVHQLETTVDFARRSWVMTWLLGGLNFQIEHHLFPQICHVHYPELSKIVEQTCQEYGIRYTNHGSFMAGLGSHYRWLRELGRSDAVPAA